VERARFIATAKSGVGARSSGGRWNSPGLPAIYCGESLPLCLLEILVHATTAAERSDPRVWFRITLPADQVLSVLPARLPEGWNDPMRLHPDTVAMGDRWLRAGHKLALRVPSALVAGSFNYVLNPLHPAFRLTHWSKPTPLPLDVRLQAG
jgi:RES domain-containing protein